MNNMSLEDERKQRLLMRRLTWLGVAIFVVGITTAVIQGMVLGMPAYLAIVIGCLGMVLPGISIGYRARIDTELRMRNTGTGIPFYE